MTTPAHTPGPAADPPLVGVEWVVEALGCDPARLRDPATVRGACDRALRELDLHAVGPGLWHQFPAPGGVTGLYLLTESHLACHTYPEHRLATFNLYCCRPRARWPWEERLGEALGATRVVVRSLPRGTSLPSPLAGEGGPRANASGPGEGSGESNPSPGSVGCASLATLSRKGRGEEGAVAVVMAFPSSSSAEAHR